MYNRNGIDFLPRLFFIYDEHVGEPSFRCAFGDGLEGEVCPAARTEGAPWEDIQEVAGKDVGWTT